MTVPDPWTNQTIVPNVEARYWFAPDVQFRCTWPRRGRSQIMVDVAVETTGVGGGMILPTVRVNLLSNSARSGLFRNQERRDELQEMWMAVVADLHGWYRRDLIEATNPDPAKRRTERVKAPAWLIYPFWPAEGATGIVGTHESLKTYAGVAAALSLTTGENLLGGNAKVSQGARKVLYLDWEADVGSFADRVGALLVGHSLPLEPVLTHMVMRDSIMDAVPSLVERVQVGGYAAVVVDSMSASIGGAGLVGDDSVNGFWDAIRAMGVPALVLAHKSAQSGRTGEARFFGSVMSEARVRMAWNVETEKPAEGDTTRRVLWTCFKDNNHGSRGNRLAWEWSFFTEGEHDDRRIDAVTIDALNPNAVSLAEADQGQKPRGPGETHLRIVAAIERQGGPVTRAALVDAVGKSPNTVGKTLRRMVEAGVIVDAGSGAYAMPGSQSALPDPF